MCKEILTSLHYEISYSLAYHSSPTGIIYRWLIQSMFWALNFTPMLNLIGFWSPLLDLYLFCWRRSTKSITALKEWEINSAWERLANSSLNPKDCCFKISPSHSCASFHSFCLLCTCAEGINMQATWGKPEWKTSPEHLCALVTSSYPFLLPGRDSQCYHRTIDYTAGFLCHTHTKNKQTNK